ncbi:hypothetical protein GCM10010140_08350 [Streptosporangium pseudovulgare]|uniref:Uncharacterized protein n=2 Tax=Streptosporangium pseudovulgare TaxID=35765 RepID=A0ABQ2QKC9_9ACTN|nr:hypothetical protein GCM10010140_08350 [Streptosporangium pseudovulgare]
MPFSCRSRAPFRVPGTGTPDWTRIAGEAPFGKRWEDTMATMIDRIRRYLAGPQGRRTVERVKVMARDPRNQQRARELMARLRGNRAAGPRR